MSAPGRHRASPRVRRKRAVAAAVAILIVAAGVVGFLLVRDAGVERFCGRPDDLVTRDGVSLTVDAMEAFEEAEAAVGPIDVVQSFRSCREQGQACERICGDRRGCPDLCAPPGFSWHQRGLAIDVTQGTLDTPGVIEALEAAGWCQALPGSDPGHFSFDGCH